MDHTAGRSHRSSEQIHRPRLHGAAPIRACARRLFRLTYIHNPGAAFGLNVGSPLLHTAFSILALGILIYLYRSLAANERLLRLALCLVLGGAVGNIIDRLYLGEVVDFFDFGLGDLRWPIFNFADSFVTVGVLLLALGYSRREKAPASPAEEATPS